MIKQFYYAGAVLLLVVAFAALFAGFVPLPPSLQPLIH